MASDLINFYFPSGGGSSKVKPYIPGKTYKVNDLVIDPDQTGLFLVTQDFVATDFNTDISNGNLKALSGSQLTYKQYVIGQVDTVPYTITIPLTTPNYSYDRHTFVIKSLNNSSVGVIIYDADADLTWNTGTDISITSDGIGLKVTETFPLSPSGNSNITYKEVSLDITVPRKEILSISTT